jgi:ABC-type uncharacterized transport system substrate-binding protein
MTRISKWMSVAAAGAGIVATLAMSRAGAGTRPGTGSAPGAKPLIVLIRAADWMGHEWSEDAIRVGLQEAGLEAGHDYELKTTSAQGDLATLPNLLDAAIDAHAKIIVALQDATLEVAVHRVKGTPIVFHLLSDPFAAGAGTSDSNHLPNVTGVYSPGFGDPEQTRRVDLIRRIVPAAKQLGILFSPEEKLSVVFKDRMTAAARRAGLRATAVPVSAMAEVGPATRTLCSLKVDAIELFGNAAHAGFPALIKEARGCRIPVFSPAPFEVMQGAVASIFPDFAEGGAVAGGMIARILKGESPAKIPFYRIETTKLAVNPAAAGSAGVSVPAEVVKQADTVVGPHR